MHSFPLPKIFLAWSVISLTCWADKDDKKPKNLPKGPGNQWLEFPGRAPDNATKVTLLSGDHESRSEESFARLGKVLADHYGWQTTVLFPLDEETGYIDPNEPANAANFNSIAAADLLILSLRHREYEEGNITTLLEYFKSGKPILALRHSLAAFSYDQKPHASTSYLDWQSPQGDWTGGFGQRLLGSAWHGHWSTVGQNSTLLLSEPNSQHPILQGYASVHLPTAIPEVKLDSACTVLLRGQVLTGMAPDAPPASGQRKQQEVNQPMMPVAWVHPYQIPDGKPGEAFTCTLGSAEDFALPEFQQLITKATCWLLSKPYSTSPAWPTLTKSSPSGFMQFRTKVLPKDLLTNSLPFEPTKTDVFLAGQNGYQTYRIPSLLADGKGGLLAFCEARSTKSDTGEIDLVLRRSLDNGKTWGDLQVVWEDPGHTCGNPCPVLDTSTNTLWLLMTWNDGKVAEAKMNAGFGTDSRRVFVTHSKDYGVSWAAPQDITQRVKKPEWSWYATGPGAGIQIKHGPHAGRLVIACDHKIPNAKGVLLGAHIIYSDDHGTTWTLGGAAPQDKVNESEVVELSGGQLMLNMRNYNREIPYRQTCVSKDGGITWQGQRHDQTLLDPVCQASLRRLSWPKNDQPGRVIFANPASTKKRENLTLRLSEDDCQSWKSSRLLHAGSSAYSSLAIVKDSTIGCLYEADDYQRIIFASVELSWLTGE